MRSQKELKKQFLEKYPEMDDCIADAVATLMLSEEELYKEKMAELTNPSLPQESKEEFVRELVKMNIKAAEELLSEAKPKN